ncbi:hypothetical protein FHL15_003860 [Xylaria flabelliformis]|uniref:Uncharacterized protein n=1 Tax=Xylaria flabelliformis TaxID=2512241 RepID=A0A553I4N0_9PEZI|nr:hypothetical protein FHL15_003860 [Xylaria flabelliformis]
MSDTDRGGGHDGDRGRQPNRPGSPSSNRTKRNRSVSTDGDNSSERSSAIGRRDLHQYQDERLQSIRQAHSIQGTFTIAEGSRRMPLAQGLNMSIGSTADVRARMRHANPHSTWVYGEIQPASMTDIITPSTRIREPPRRRADPNRQIAFDFDAFRARRLEEDRIIQERELAGGDRCAVCNSVMHEAKRCSALLGPGPWVERHKGFKKWCPYHLTTSHSMDDCKQKWTWLRDAKKVTEMLVENCGAGPAFATNLIDWRCLLETVPPNIAITILPWTPEFALAKKRDEPNFHVRNAREIDPNTMNVASTEAIKKWQTENGEEPRFHNFHHLRQHAEKEYQKFQQEMNRKRQLAAKKEEDDGRVIEEFKRICIQKQSLEKQEKALLQQHANDPELLKKLDRIVEMASLETCKQEDVEIKIKKENDS